MKIDYQSNADHIALNGVVGNLYAEIPNVNLSENNINIDALNLKILPFYFTHKQKLILQQNRARKTVKKLNRITKHLNGQT